MRSSLLSIIIFFFFTSCGYRVDPTKYVPNDASFVHIFDINSLQKYKNDKIMSVYSKIWKQNVPDNLQKYILKTYKNSGINATYRTYSFGKNSVNKEENYTTWIFHLDNEKLFDRFIRNMPNNNYGIKSRNGLYYSYLNEKFLVLWGNKVAWIMMSETNKKPSQLVNQIFKLKEIQNSKTLKSKNIAFQNLIKKKLDVGIWLNWEQQNNDLVTYIKNTTGITFDKKDAYITLDWQLDSLKKLETNIKIYPEIRSLANFDELFANDLDKNMIQAIPKDSLLGVWNWNLKKKGFENLQSTWNSQQWWEKTLTLKGFSYQKWFDIINGEVIYFERENKKGIPQTAWGIKVKNKALLEVAFKQLEKENEIQKLDNQNNIYLWKKTKYYLVVNDKIIWATNSLNLAITLQKNKTSLNNTINIPQNVSNWGFIRPNASLYVPNNELAIKNNQTLYWYILPVKQEIFDFKQVIQLQKEEDFWENVNLFLK